VVIPGADEERCPRAWCSSAGCENTYLAEGGWLGEPSWVCEAGADVIFETCTAGVGPQTLEVDQTAPAPVTGPLQVSGDGRCGGQWTCDGSQFGVSFLSPYKLRAGDVLIPSSLAVRSMVSAASRRRTARMVVSHLLEHALERLLFPLRLRRAQYHRMESVVEQRGSRVLGALGE
jgi:hypothetical protein